MFATAASFVIFARTSALNSRLVLYSHSCIQITAAHKCTVARGRLQKRASFSAFEVRVCKGVTQGFTKRARRGQGSQGCRGYRAGVYRGRHRCPRRRGGGFTRVSHLLRRVHSKRVPLQKRGTPSALEVGVYKGVTQGFTTRDSGWGRGSTEKSG
jgi:hypothetical protein